MALTATKLRANVYSILDEVIATGKPVDVERNGHLVTISRVAPVRSGKKIPRLNRLQKRDFIVGDPDDLVHIDWSLLWNPRDE
ncbi:MAG: hypothetical protein SFV18_02540 [Bryobacteraceae bacterium]|nr:hypothetical protein [Bryobacteraceae bacterium]